MDRCALAFNYRKEKYNCAQAVAAPFADLLETTPDELAAAMSGFGGGMGGLMAQAQKMQAKIAKVQEEIAAMEVAGESGGGAVKVVITGKHECKSVVIDPSVVDPEDVEMLQDLIQLAFNSAQTRLSEISEERMRKEVPLPPGMKLPF